MMKIFLPVKFLLIAIPVLLYVNCSAKGPEQKVISSEEILQKIKNNEDIYYKGVQISGDLDFTGIFPGNDEARGTIRSYINSSISFVDCIFEGKIIGYKKLLEEVYSTTSFEKNITFIRCVFLEEINLRDCYIKGMANFTNSNFKKEFNMQGATLGNRENYFTECVFEAPALFQRVIVDGNINFLKSDFDQKLSFQNAFFKSDVQFGAAKFLDIVDFSRVKALGYLLFNYSTFSDTKMATFSSSTFWGRVEFIDCKLNNGLNLKGSTFFDEVKFNNTHFNNEVNFENAIFYLGMPQRENISKTDSTRLIFNNTKYIKFNNLETTDF